MAVGADYLVYGMNKNAILFLFKFDRKLNQYVYIMKTDESSKQNKSHKSRNNGIEKLAVNLFTLPLEFGNE